MGYAVADLQGKEYGKTKVLDFQIHNYGRNFIADVFVQNYKGFYTEKRKTITLYPDVSVRQIGAEGTYLFNGKTFSAKAAFQHSEKQLQSTGSFAIGVGFMFTACTWETNCLLSAKTILIIYRLA